MLSRGQTLSERSDVIGMSSTVGYCRQAPQRGPEATHSEGQAHDLTVRQLFIFSRRQDHIEDTTLPNDAVDSSTIAERETGVMTAA